MGPDVPALSYSHQFVEEIPDVADPGILYISIPFSTMVHLCACGCGREVVTPLSPAGWQLTYDGQTVSLYPSIGNWSLPCRSHYWLEGGRVVGARRWTDAEIDLNRRADASAIRRHLALKQPLPTGSFLSQVDSDGEPRKAIGSAQARGAAHCWFPSVDRVARDAATTAWKLQARLGQARWRETRGFPVGYQPYAGGVGATLVGSRLELAFAKASAANFITPAARSAAHDRLANPESHQLLDEDRLWADLLSSMPLCFNLFGELHGDNACVRNAVRAWWPGAPEGTWRVRFEHSPGRRDIEYLGNKSAFDAAFVIESPNRSAIIGVETKYHEHAKREPPPRTAALARYIEVTERSEAFVDDWQARVIGTDLQQIWLDHLLVLSMMQHPRQQCAWGRFVLVYPAANPSFTRAAAEYRAVLKVGDTFEARTIESLLMAPNVLSAETVAAFRERYIVSA